MDGLPYLLVAERSVVPMANLVLEALETHARPSSIFIVVPRVQVQEFLLTRCARHQVIAEEEILPEWSLRRIQAMLRRYPERAGWYLQQFLKLGFGAAAAVPRYVVWDADTVMLARPTLTHRGRVVMSASREFHRPYFRTFERLFGRRRVLSRSVISQYMLMETAVVSEMQDEIEHRHRQGWIEAILEGLPGCSPSEFSEYETYGNFLESRHPGSVLLRQIKWFRYGSYLLPAAESRTTPHVCRTFDGYAYVAFERHPDRAWKALAAKLMHSLRIGS